MTASIFGDLDDNLASYKDSVSLSTLSTTVSVERRSVDSWLQVKMFCCGTVICRDSINCYVVTVIWIRIATIFYREDYLLFILQKN